ADGRFGGISGLRWQATQNRLLAVTDRGDWLAIATDEKDGRLTGLGGVEIGRLTGPNGRPLEGKRVSDAEALALTQGAALITFENDHRIASYDLDADGVPAGAANPGLIPADDWFAAQRGNGGVEALATYAGPGGRAGYILLSEDLRDARGRSRGVRYQVGPDGAVAETALSLPILDPLRPTDAVANEETLFVLARSFSPLRGVAVELLAFDLDSDLAESERLAAFRPPLTIDNMEGLALRTVAGRTYIYMVSDDNFSPLQRTLLLKFEVTG
ncbi:MAG: esterase-like activity of phytase family protein, partial [Pseudomonadota bacterium]